MQLRNEILNASNMQGRHQLCKTFFQSICFFYFSLGLTNSTNSHRLSGETAHLIEFFEDKWSVVVQ